MRQRLFKVSFSAFLVIMILGCSVKYMAGHAKVASNVSGRELPIYSVDTPEKKAALTFDAAWGNESMPVSYTHLKRWRKNCWRRSCVRNAEDIMSMGRAADAGTTITMKDRDAAMKGTGTIMRKRGIVMENAAAIIMRNMGIAMENAAAIIMKSMSTCLLYTSRCV